MNKIHLQFGINFQDLYSVKGLANLDDKFLNFLLVKNHNVHKSLVAYRAQPDYNSKVITAVAPYIEQFIAELFSITLEVTNNQKMQLDYEIIYACKRNFIIRQIYNKYRNDKVMYKEFSATKYEIEQYLSAQYTDHLYANKVMYWLDNKENYKTEIASATQFAISSIFSEAGQVYHKSSALFNLPLKIDADNLVRNINTHNNITTVKSAYATNRIGFALTDQGLSAKQSFAQAKYCLICHGRSKDSCSSGLLAKQTDNFVTHATGKVLSGCPLEQKISEMNLMKTMGMDIAALAIITIDNPLVAATGHRICNDCTAACIFQQQDPVDIPGVETQILKSVLQMDWGVEIYSLLVKWNPLRLADISPRPSSNKKAMIVGMGPAGFTLAHYLLQEGHTVVGIDGLRILPIANDLLTKPIKNINNIWQDISTRESNGFGGVAEYGITARWDKNFLTVIRLILQRQTNFKLFGGIRLGGNVTIEQAFNELQINHLALCVGAGKPYLPNITNNLAKGVRLASDFLMSLQLMGASKDSSIANLEIELPVVVIGGGLTAIDTATECLAYYPIQVEKFLTMYEKLCKTKTTQEIRSSWTKSECKKADQWINHAKILRTETKQAQLKNITPNHLQYLNEWGGVSIVYRKSLQQSPAYKTNHEELTKALQEGIKFIANATPLEFDINEDKHVSVMKVEIHGCNSTIKANTVMIATGTKPNTSLANEYSDIFALENDFFKLKSNNMVHTKNNQYSISTWGDCHPEFYGSVVKAMASVKRGYKEVSNYLNSQHSTNNTNYFQTIDNCLQSTVKMINRLTHNVIEIIIESPFAVKNFKPGMFYKLQNFSPIKGFDIKNIALTGAWINKKKNLIALIILDVGASSKLCCYLEPGQKVSLMGPTGSPTIIRPKETVCLIGGGLGNAVLFSIAQAFKKVGSKIIYIAGYKSERDIFHRDKISKYADHVIWSIEQLKPTSDKDYSIQGNVIDGIDAFASNIFNFSCNITDIDRFITIGSDKMMAAVKHTLTHSMKEKLKPKAKFVASINSPMNCMMKGICAQCLQKHVDPENNVEYFVYSCVNQDQCMKTVDFDHLSVRLKQNSLQEKLTGNFVETAMGNT